MGKGLIVNQLFWLEPHTDFQVSSADLCILHRPKGSHDQRVECFLSETIDNLTYQATVNVIWLDSVDDSHEAGLARESSWIHRACLKQVLY